VVLFFFIGRIWDRWGTTDEVHKTVERAKEESRQQRPPIPPAAPSGLSASPLSDSQINLSWADNSDSEEGFKLERKLGPAGTYTLLATLGPNATIYADLGLAAETSASYRIKSFDAHGESAVSNDATGTTTAKSILTGNSWSNPSTWFWYVIVPAISLILTLSVMFGLLLYKSMRVRTYILQEAIMRSGGRPIP
jgi:hypothetical protein